MYCLASFSSHHLSSRLSRASHTLFGYKTSAISSTFVIHLLIIMVAGLIFLMAGVAAAAGHGYHHHGYLHLNHPKCTKQIETVTRERCRLESTETGELITMSRPK